MKTIFVLFILLLSLGSIGQGLVTPLEAEDIYLMKSATVTLNDNSQVIGNKFTTWILNNGMLSSFTLKTLNGEKVKLNAEGVKNVKIETDERAKAMMFMENISMNKIVHNDYAFLEHLDTVYYEKVEVKPGNFKLLQLLNPGFDQYIKVYLDPNANSANTSSTTGAFGNGEDKSFYIKKGDRSFLLKKKNYKDEFTTLFGDCQALMDMAAAKEIDVKLSQMPLHIAIYNENK